MATVIEEVQAKTAEMTIGLNNLKLKVQALQSLIAAGGTVEQVDAAAQPVLDLIDELNNLAQPPQAKPGILDEGETEVYDASEPIPSGDGQ